MSGGQSDARDRDGEVLPSFDDARHSDMVNHPPHYTRHPSGVECIDVVRHMNFNLGNAVKYIWRCDEKGNAVEDLRKAVFYLQDEIRLRGGAV
jgi:hypothetical protein